jgi:hypothetical protein
MSSVVATFLETPAQRWCYALWKNGTIYQFFPSPDKPSALAAAEFAGSQPDTCLFSRNRQFVAIQTQGNLIQAVIVTLPQKISTTDLDPQRGKVAIQIASIHTFPHLPSVTQALQCALRAKLPCVPNFFGDFPMNSGLKARD